MYKYQATVFDPRCKMTEFDSVEEAIAHVEAVGSGSIVQFHLHKNLPGCLPEWVYNSCALWTYEDSKWWSHFIYDGVGGRNKEERPHE